jgi:hypothetical protein
MLRKKTVISHIYNEEYLLFWWLNHHKNIFDDGILIDYQSTDKSIEICKTICPHWNIVQSVNKDFNAHNVDREVEHYESLVQGWKISLNITEFLVGDLDTTISQHKNDQLLIPSISFFDWNPLGTFDKTKPLWYQKYFGIDYKTDFSFRHARSLHNFNIKYHLGRHFLQYNCENLLIFHYANCISSQEMLFRRLQIQHKIPQSDKIINLGFQHHNHGLGLKEEDLRMLYDNLMNKKIIKNQSYYINKLVDNVQ